MSTKQFSLALLTMLLILPSAGCVAQPGLAPSAAASTSANATQVTAGPQGVPVFQPASSITATDQILNFKTTADVATVSQFYIDQMPKLGWSPVGDPYIADTVAKITFSKSGKVADIGIAFDAKSNVTSIGILVQ